jgi:hypothetical protein
MMLKEHHERDPLVKQTISENNSFIKLHEGYPIFYAKTEMKKIHDIQVTPTANPCQILEIFESLGQGVKVGSACFHAVREILDCHQPDNGLIASLYELITMEFMLSELRAIKAENRGDNIVSSRDMELIEDTSVLGNSENMLFFMKELSASHEDSTIIKNPSIITKLDIGSMDRFDFDESQLSNFKKKNRDDYDAKSAAEAAALAAQRNKDGDKGEIKDDEYVKDLDTVEALEKMLDDPDDSVSDVDGINGDLN